MCEWHLSACKSQCNCAVCRKGYKVGSVLNPTRGLSFEQQLSCQTLLALCALLLAPAALLVQTAASSAGIADRLWVRLRLLRVTTAAARMPAHQIQYSEKYYDDIYEYRHASWVLPRPH